MRWGSALGSVAVAGFMLRAAFPAPALWWLAPIAVALWLAALLGRGFWAGAGLSLVGGLAFWLTLVNWTSLYLGPLPWLALGSLMALEMALGGGLIAWLWRWIPRLWPGQVARVIVLPATAASAWVAREWLAATWPYGGFSWGRIAMSQTEGVFAPALSWIGATGLSWLLVALAATAVQLLASPRSTASHRPWVSWLRLALGFALLGSLPVWPVASTGALRVLAVQGGADASLFTNLPAGTVFNAHIEESLRSSDESVDLVVWPENAADIDPLESTAAKAALDSLTERFQAPFVVGAVTKRDGLFFNSSLVWLPDRGVNDIYDKAHPVPFAEYMPDRAFWRPFAPDLIDLIGRDYQTGTQPNVVAVAGSRAGVAICFDIAYDDLIGNMMQGGAELIIAQTNNADFGRTDESIQQLAIARMRALETGRAVVNISTVGTSAIIRADGSTLAQLPTWRAGSLLEDVPLASGPTLATMLTPVIVPLTTGFAPALVVLIGAVRLLRYSSSKSRISPRRARSQSSRS